MNWRAWVRNVLIASPAVTALVPASRIHGAGSLRNRPSEAPFIVLRFGDKLGEPGVPADDTEGLVVVHDEPGGYTRIDDVLRVVRETLVMDITDAGGVAVEWQGDSGDLADDAWDTIYRNGSYRLLERRA